MKETKIVFDDINNQSIVSKIDTDIVSIDMEDKPLIYISEVAIYLKRDNDNLRKENNQYKEVLDKIKEYIKESIECSKGVLSNPEHAIVGKYELIKLEIENYKKILELLEE